MTSYNLPPPGFPFQLVLLKDNQAFVANDGELSLVKATAESSNQFFVLEEEPTTEGNKTYKIKRFEADEDSKASLQDPPPGGSLLFASSPHKGNLMSALSIDHQSLAVNSVDDVDDWGDILQYLQYPSTASYLQGIILQGDWEVMDADYDTSAGQVNEPAPLILATQTVTNDLDNTQTSEVDLSRSVAETHSFTFTAGCSLDIGASFSVGVPLVADGKVETKFTAKTDFSWGNATTTTTTVGDRITVSAAPRSKVKVTGTINCSTFDVPCTLSLRSKLDNTVTTHSKVVYHGLTYWNFDVKYEPV